jgi:hypothetical protein
MKIPIKENSKGECDQCQQASEKASYNSEDRPENSGKYAEKYTAHGQPDWGGENQNQDYQDGCGSASALHNGIFRPLPQKPFSNSGMLKSV